MRILIIAIACFIGSAKLSGQNSVTLKLHTFSVHPFAKQNAELHHRTIAGVKELTLEPGIIAAFETTAGQNLAFHVSTAVLADRFQGISGYTHAGISYKLFKARRHSVRIGFGPAIHYASSRTDIADYTNEENYKQASFPPDYKFSFISGFIEYNSIINKKLAFSAALTHSHPHSVGLSVGIRFRKVGKGKKGCNCPSY